MNVYYEPLDTDLTREMVAHEKDGATLLEWYNEQAQIASELRIMSSALRDTDPDAARRMTRKLGYVQISISWLTSALNDAGIELPEKARGKELRQLRHQCTMLQQALATKNAKLKAARERIAHLEGALRDKKEAA